MIYARTETVGGERVFTLQTRAAGGDPRLVSRAAARLQFEGTIAVDLARLTSPDQPLRLAGQLDVTGAAMSYLRFPSMPRLEVARLRRAAASAYAAFRTDPDDDATRQVVAALRWLSLALTRWRESPTMAATLAYIALDTASKGCVDRHRKGCAGDSFHETAIDRYVRTLRERLAGEIESYLLRVRGVTRNIERGQRNPDPWMSKVQLRRHGRPVGAWAKQLTAAMAGFEGSDPLLRFHLAEVVKLRGQRLAAVRRRCVDDLRELRLARNELVHDKDLLLAEQRTSYLTSLASEMLLLRVEA